MLISLDCAVWGAGPRSSQSSAEMAGEEQRGEWVGGGMLVCLLAWSDLPLRPHHYGAGRCGAGAWPMGTRGRGASGYSRHADIFTNDPPLALNWPCKSTRCRRLGEWIVCGYKLGSKHACLRVCVMTTATFWVFRADLWMRVCVCVRGGILRFLSILSRTILSRFRKVHNQFFYKK